MFYPLSNGVPLGCPYRLRAFIHGIYHRAWLFQIPEEREVCSSEKARERQFSCLVYDTSCLLFRSLIKQAVCVLFWHLSIPPFIPDMWHYPQALVLGLPLRWRHVGRVTSWSPFSFTWLWPGLPFYRKNFPKNILYILDLIMIESIYLLDYKIYVYISLSLSMYYM